MNKVVYCEGEIKSPDHPEKSTFKHPRVFLTFGANSKVICPYCSRVFEKEGASTPTE